VLRQVAWPRQFTGQQFVGLAYTNTKAFTSSRSLVHFLLRAKITGITIATSSVATVVVTAEQVPCDYALYKVLLGDACS